MKKLKAVSVAVVMVVLILDNRCALVSASEGMNLCLKTVIPALFPFFVLSALLTANAGALPRPVSSLFCAGPNAGGALLSGLLGGYPVGAKSVSQAYARGAISKEEAQRLLPVCNQCGPAFLFGIVTCLFDNALYGALIWGIQLLSAIVLAHLIPSKPYSKAPTQPVRTKNLSLSEAMTQSLQAIATVCGWIILMRVLFGFLDRWFLWALPQPVRIFLCGVLELTNGCTELWNLGDIKARFILAVVLTGFGGICVSLQALSLVHPDLKGSYYFPGKLIQAGISSLLASILTGTYYSLGGFITLLGFTGLFITKFGKKTVAFPRRRVYNGGIKEMRMELCSSEKR